MYIGQSPASYTLAINSEFEHEHEYQSIPIFPRKGGGGGGEGGGDHFSGGGEGGGGRTGSSSSSSPGVHLSGDTGITGKTASVHSSGGGKPFTISGNSPFKGRLAGGGNRVRDMPCHFLSHLTLYLSWLIHLFPDRVRFTEPHDMGADTPTEGLGHTSITGRYPSSFTLSLFTRTIMAQIRTLT
ncbi:hypothetical protein JAAARDRAFT_301784 [Jaapia argillacea MUCL 33604]|uniref:Uncharacterized protein n=1 Tax=Jaapia argillacea MUCL 33604 TaxID=933084 RepID=A0A067Q2I7_9AGAM|nr:hypothetical protein JAAARDRAFT_301784 [Jaapia argillacea MUCL 33604]